MFKQVKQSLETMKEQENDEEESPDTCDEQYQSLYWSQMADAVSEQGGIGLWKPCIINSNNRLTIPAFPAAY